MLKSLNRMMYWFGKNYYRIMGIAFWLTALFHFKDTTLFWILMVGAVQTWGIGFIAHKILDQH